MHFDSYKNLLRRRSLISRRLRQGRARPVPQNVARLQSLELQVIWEYLGYDPPVNCRRTLDQYGYPSLRDTRPRDDDQMLYKMTKERISLSDQVGLDTYDNPSESPHRTRRETSSAGSKAHGDDCECSDEEAAVNEDEVLNGNVLMVDQLWMWAVGPSKLQVSPLYFATLSLPGRRDPSDLFFAPRERYSRGSPLPAGGSPRQHLQRCECRRYAPM